MIVSLKCELEELEAKTNKILSIEYAEKILSWDAQTGAPRSGALERSEALGYFSALKHSIIVNKDYKQLLDRLFEYKGELSDIDCKIVEKSIKEYEKLNKIPSEEMVEYEKLISRSQHSWEEARAKNDFLIFSKDLKEIVKTLKRFAKYRDGNKHPYDIFLDDYEEGMTMEKLDIFFTALKSRIVPLLKNIMKSEAEIRDDFLLKNYELQSQREFAKVLLNDLKFDLSKGILTESTHPFTSGVSIADVRLTSRYEENNFISGILSTAHEGGHALYEQNIDSRLRGTPLATGTSLGIHESQSRIYENNFCKSEEFVKFLLPKLKKFFPEQLNNVSESEFYKGINIVKPSFIRVDADELTYPLHIMIRYEIEVALLEGTIDVDDLPSVWNKKMEEYLGIIPETDSLGVLQDVHWSFGLFGYFPTYAIGSAYAAQFFYKIEKEMDINCILRKGEMDTPLNWLRENIHNFGSLLNPDEISLKATDEILNPDYFCDYLEDKFSKIYNLV